MYEIILSETIPREEIGRIAGERISDYGVSPWVGRELCGLHTVAIHYRDGSTSYVTANMEAATQAMRFLTARPYLSWEHPDSTEAPR